MRKYIKKAKGSESVTAITLTLNLSSVLGPTGCPTSITQARNQDFLWGGANEAKADPTTEMYFLSSDPFI